MGRELVGRLAQPRSDVHYNMLRAVPVYKALLSKYMQADIKYSQRLN